MPASRSLIALLAGTVVLFALYFVAFKPSSSNSGGSSGSSQGLHGLQSDINKAKGAVATSNASNAASGNENAGTGAASQSSPAASGGSPASSKTATSSSPSTTKTTKPSQPPVGKSKTKPATAAQNLSTVQAAMSAHKVVAMLFYNPAAADDQAVRHELSSVPAHGGRVVKLAIPLSQASSFVAVTQQVPLNFSPTLVLISPTAQVTEIVGYADSFEIGQRVADAFAAS